MNRKTVMRKKFLICTFKTIINNSKRSFTQPIDLLFIFQLQNIHIKRTIFKFHRSAPPLFLKGGGVIFDYLPQTGGGGI